MTFETSGTAPTVRARSSQPSEYTHPLVQEVLAGAEQAARELLERFQPRTIEEAVGLLRADGAPSAKAFDRIADAWATYRHTMHLSWD